MGHHHMQWIAIYCHAMSCPGVAAIHANLDRRLQSVLLAWGTVVRDGQRETAYQRQLDIAAAESAAGDGVYSPLHNCIEAHVSHDRNEENVWASKNKFALWFLLTCQGEHLKNTCGSLSLRRHLCHAPD